MPERNCYGRLKLKHILHSKLLANMHVVSILTPRPCSKARKVIHGKATEQPASTAAVVVVVYIKYTYRRKVVQKCVALGVPCKPSNDHGEFDAVLRFLPEEECVFEWLIILTFL